MWRLREFLPEGLKNYYKLIAAKRRYPNAFIGSPFVGERVEIGRGCSISRGVELGDGVTLDEFSYVNAGAIIGSGRIGKFCSIGPYAIIGMPEHPTSHLSTSPKLYGKSNLFGVPSQWDDFPAPPEIGSDVWIGAMAFVKQGVRIGHGAVVGAGAVVTRDVEPYAVVGGVPARVIRRRFDPQTVESLLDSRWWELKTDQLKPLRNHFHAPLAEVSLK
jgi:virginiamycin A acetyltransferase